MARTPEQGHSAACLAKAMIAAIENLRDVHIDDARRLGQPSLGDHGFTLDAQDNRFLDEAFGYLDDNTISCVCPDLEPYPVDADDDDHAERRAFAAMGL